MGDCQLAARASMSIGTTLATHDVQTFHELLARWVPRAEHTAVPLESTITSLCPLSPERITFQMIEE
jgi:hypothetical protein